MHSWFSPQASPILLASRVLVEASTMLTQGHTLPIKKKKKKRPSCTSTFFLGRISRAEDREMTDSLLLNFSQPQPTSCSCRGCPAPSRPALTCCMRRGGTGDKSPLPFFRDSLWISNRYVVHPQWRGKNGISFLSSVCSPLSLPFSNLSRTLNSHSFL